MSFALKGHVHKKIKHGDNINNILLKAKFPQKAVNSIIGKNKFLRFVSLAPKQLYTINSQSQIRTLSIYQEQAKKLQFWYDTKTKKAGVKNINDGLTIKTQKFQGKIKGSLYGTITAKVKDSIIPYKFQDIFVLHYNLKRDLKRGAQYSFVIEKKYHGDQFIKYGQILEAELEIKNKIVKRRLFKKGKTLTYLGPENENKRPFYSPVDYQHFTSLFMKRRFHPVKRRYMAHQGIDFGLPEGRSIYAVKNGRITKLGYNRFAGNYIAIKHRNGYVSYYNHLSKIHKNLKVGSRVKSGQTIGWNGCSGSCTKPHLHFAVKKNGRYLDPISLVKSFPHKAKELNNRIIKF